MNSLEKIFKEFPHKHHAYGIESYSLRPIEVIELVNSQNYSYVFEKSYEVFKIDDARTVKHLQSEKTDRASLFVLKFSRITHEAQNALLKVLEEPTRDTYFILIFPSLNNLLLTLQSRLEIIQHKDQNMDRNEKIVSINDYLDMTLFERFEYNKKYTDKKSKDIEVFTKQDILGFLNKCESYLVQEKKESVQEIFKLKKYLNANGASIKMILDHLAVMLM